ncbi:MAG: DUF1501 domain-containing protein [Verrucomicrobia bacterium]|nr:DUF1501 domain-containing protein [Verrucomicrobiota bacterium]
MKNSNTCGRHAVALNRREFLQKSAHGFGAVALGSLLMREDLHATGALSRNPLSVRLPHFASKAQHVIFLFMTGGPSHMDTFDPKPELQKYDGKPLPDSFKSDGLMLQFMKATDGRLMGSPFKFQRYGQSGLEVSDLFRHVARHADDLAVIRSCYHESFIHGPALGLLHCGTAKLGYPSTGAWVMYGLGSLSDNLPSYMVMSDGGFRAGAAVSFGSGFLPAAYQGTVIRTEGAPIQNLTPPFEKEEQRRVLDYVNRWNQRHHTERPDDTRLEARLANYELAFRMQTAAPDLIDISKEPAATRELYGVDKGPTAKFGRMCLLARRMVERGVRYVQLYNNDWDGHGECAKNHESNAERVDQPIAALLTDLKQRGLLENTLVVWTGEFGRTPVMQGSLGRDHNPYGFTTWLAGGGIRGGKAIGATDEFGFRAVEDKVHVHDLHATLLTFLGLDHERLTYLFEGRQQRLTDVGGHNNLFERLTRA